jgi:hypothetical protein
MPESNGPAQAPLDTTSPSASLSVQIEGDLAQAVQERATRIGSSAEQIVRSAVEDMLRHDRAAQERQWQQSQPPPEQVTVSVVCDDGSTTETIRLRRSEAMESTDEWIDGWNRDWRRDLFTTATKRSNDLYVVAAQEMDNGARRAPSKHLLLRECSPDYAAGEGHWIGGAAFLFPVSKIAWLIEALGQAQQVLGAEARANRKAALETRRLRTTEEVEEEREQRQAWTEKRGREAWQQAVTLATAHRKGALRLGLTRHFAPWEWLELCARCDFRCPLCGLAEGNRYPEQKPGRLQPSAHAGKEVRLQPHHHRELAQGGDNTIANILPLCADCHSDIHHSFRVRLDASPDWLDTQRALCERLSPGMLVTRRRDVLQQQRPDRSGEPEPVPELTRHYPPSWSVGIVVTVKPPERVGAGYARSWGYKEYYGLVMDEDGVSVWQAGTVEVRWQKGWSGESALVSQADVSRLRPLDDETAQWFMDKWTKEQEKNRTVFAVGDLVRPKGLRRTHRSQIMEILPADPVLLCPVRAVIRNTAGKKERRTIEMTELKAADAI